MAVYEIFAVRYAGPFIGKRAIVRWNEGWDEDMERDYFVWAVRDRESGGFTIVDAGVGITLAAKRGLTGYTNPVDMLARIGATGSTVSRVVLTHMHFDHAGGMEMFPEAFPDATFYVQKREFDFWVRDPISRRAPFAASSDEIAIARLASMEQSSRLVLVDGDRVISPGMELLLAPGHTVGHQVLAVATVKGTAIVASDCAHVAESFRDDIPSCFITDLVAWMKSYDLLRSRASVDLIFPGHDARLLTDYPEVAPGVTRLA